MTENRFPPDLNPTPADFLASDWQEALDGRRREGYPDMWRSFSAAAQKAIDNGNLAAGKALWLVADACSMMLVRSRANDPFRPALQVQGQRSAIPADFAPDDLVFLDGLIDSIEDPWLKARLADLLWVAGEPRQVSHALKAIDGYSSIPIDAENWSRGGQECWARGIGLARMLGRGAGARLSDMEGHLLNAFDATTSADPMWALRLNDVFRESGLGQSRARDLADRFRHLGQSCQENGELHAARECFEAAAEWYRKCEDEVAVADLIAAKAAAWTLEGLARRSSGTPSYMAAASFFEHAIQSYRSIPGGHRERLDVDRRLAELHVDLESANERSLGEMGTIQSPKIDITELVEASRTAVTGKDGVEALRAFAVMCTPPNRERLRADAVQMMQRHPLHALFPRTTLSRDGRVIAKRPAVNLGGPPTAQDEIALRAQMISNFNLTIGLMVQGQMAPALEVLAGEHRFVLGDFVNLAKGSALIPPGREQLVGKALFAGFEGDFSTALHMLVPQVEHMVRYHLKQSAVRTTRMDPDGIESEVGLSTLMDMPQVEAILGPDLCFELRALFCDPFGPNLRNELAHGLLDDEAAGSISSAYAWWMLLRMVFIAWWNASRRISSSTANAESASTEVSADGLETAPEAAELGADATE